MSRSRVSFDESQNKTFAVPSRKEAAKSKRKEQKKKRSKNRMAQKKMKMEEEAQIAVVVPVLDEKKAEPSAEDSSPEPVVEDSTDEPVTAKHEEEPVLEETAAAPVEIVQPMAEIKTAEPEVKEEEMPVAEPTQEGIAVEAETNEEIQEALEAEVVTEKVEPKAEEKEAEPEAEQEVENVTVDVVAVKPADPTVEAKKAQLELKVDTQEEMEDTTGTTEWPVTPETPAPDEKSQESIIEVTEDDDCMSVEVSYKSTASQASEDKKGVQPPRSLLDTVQKVHEPDKRSTIAGIKKKAHAMSFQKRIHSDEISITDQSFVNETTLAYRRRAMGLKERKKAAEIERKTKEEEQKQKALQYEEKMKATMEIKRREAAQMLVLAHSETISGEDDDESRGMFSLDSAAESFFDGAAMAVYNKVTLDIGKAKQAAVVPATPTFDARSMTTPSSKRGISKPSPKRSMSKPSPKKKGGALVIKSVAAESEVFVAETEKPKKWSRWVKKRLGVRS
jgi:hypothetical protein